MNLSFWLTFGLDFLIGGCLGLILAALLGAAHRRESQ